LFYVNCLLVVQLSFPGFDNGCRFGFCITFRADKTRCLICTSCHVYLHNLWSRKLRTRTQCSRPSEHSGLFFYCCCCAYYSVPINQYEDKLNLSFSIQCRYLYIQNNIIIHQPYSSPIPMTQCYPLFMNSFKF